MKRKPSGTISAKTLQDKIRVVRTDITKADEQLYGLHEHRAQLQVRLETYLELLRDLKPDNTETAASAKSLTEVAIDYLVQHPGVHASDVVDLLVTLPTTAKDPRKNAHQTLVNLRNNGRIERGEDGSLRVAVGGGKLAGNGAAPSR